MDDSTAHIWDNPYFYDKTSKETTTKSKDEDTIERNLIEAKDYKTIINNYDYDVYDNNVWFI